MSPTTEAKGKAKKKISRAEKILVNAGLVNLARLTDLERKRLAKITLLEAKVLARVKRKLHYRGSMMTSSGYF
jgi:hypothetical protein